MSENVSFGGKSWAAKQPSVQIDNLLPSQAAT
jgi:hypothetical protein